MGKSYRNERSNEDGYASGRAERDRKKDRKFAERETKRKQKERTHEQTMRVDDESEAPKYERPRSPFRGPNNATDRYQPSSTKISRPGSGGYAVEHNERSSEQHGLRSTQNNGQRQSNTSGLRDYRDKPKPGFSKPRSSSNTGR